MMGLPRSTYYSALKSSPEIQEQKDLALKDQIEQVRLTFPCYGYRKLYQHFLREGLRINDKRIRRVVRKYGLFPIFWGKKFKVQTTQSDHNLPVFPNLLKGMKETAVNQVWVADITYIRLRAEFVYLAVILDAFSRRVIGWALDRTLEDRLTLRALRRALEQRRPAPGLVHHSDRGVQYASGEYTDLLRAHGIVISMSRKANPYDNAKAESFMKTLKYEEIFREDYRDLAEAHAAIGRFLEQVYIQKRLHSALGYRPPAEFEFAVRAGQAAAVRSLATDSAMQESV